MSLSAAFRYRQGQFELDAALDLPIGITGLFGPSGCGKSTLLRCLAGLARAAGHCTVSGESWQDDRSGLFLPPHRRAIGLVFQDARLFDHLDIAGNLRYAVRRSGTQAQLEDVIALLDLGPLLRRRGVTLSGGERQRVALARALLTQPRLLLLDEPLAALDQARKAEILPYLERLQSQLQIPVLYVTHSLDEVIRLADRIALMENGRIVVTGEVHELLARLGLPLAQRIDASVMLPAHIEEHQCEHHLTALRVGRQRLWTTALDLPTGAQIRLRVQARDVSLSLDRSSRTSILNILSATVVEIAAHEPGQCMVRLSLGELPLLARLSERSVHELGLVPDMPVFAQIKSVSVA